jgi:hypothetical protein
VRTCDGVHREAPDSPPIVTTVTWNRPCRAQFVPKPAGIVGRAIAMEGFVTATLTAGARISATSLLKSRRGRAALRKTIYAPIDDHRTAASNSDIGAAWLAVGLIGIALLMALPL